MTPSRLQGLTDPPGFVWPFAKAAGAKLTLEPFFKLQGSKLTAYQQADGLDSKHKDEIKVSNKAWGTNQLFQVIRPGEISSKIVMENGKAFIPLHDLAKAFGATFNLTAAALKPNQTINLNGEVDGCKDCQLAAR